mmetsp:Transcript_69718/g.167366  ORF Transcript_69718/g.167366 Transcript_69718/m.167366 type:complete len:404 (+) Transcript_69718:91-1302(+)
MALMFSGVTDRFVFPAPKPSYKETDYHGALCWIPWKEALSFVNDIASRTGLSRGTPPALPCLWVQSETSPVVLIYFHANAEDLGHLHTLVFRLRNQLQVSILAIEYPGYGLLSDLAASEESLRSAAMAAMHFLIDEVHVEARHVVLCGRSLGSGLAVHLASAFPVGGMMLVNAFASLRAVATHLLGSTLAALAFTDAFVNTLAITNVTCPVLFIHGAHDKLVPAEQSLHLFNSCRATKKMIVMPEKMEHNSHLFADPAFFAVPAGHFFKFTCHKTDVPPSFPSRVFRRPPLVKPKLQAFKQLSDTWFCCRAGSAEDETVTTKGLPALETVSLDGDPCRPVKPQAPVMPDAEDNIDASALPKLSLGLRPLQFEGEDLPPDVLEDLEVEGGIVPLEVHRLETHRR